MSTKVIIFRSFDPVAVDLAESHLRAAEIPFVRIGRANAAILGAGDSIVEQGLEVDAEHAEQAREILASPSQTDSDPVSEPDAQEPFVTTTKMLFIGGGLSLLWPGLGMAYAGFPLTGLAVALWSFASFVGSTQDPIGLAVFGGLLPRVLDFLVTHLWLRRFGRRGLSPMLQAAFGIMLVVAFLMGMRHFSVHLWRMLPKQAADSSAE